MSTRICFVVDSGTDVRLADGLAERSKLRILARRMIGGREISQPHNGSMSVEIGPSGRLGFVAFAVRRLAASRHDTDVIMVQGYGPTAVLVNLLGRIIRRPVLMLVCSPAEAYYRCRTRAGSEKPYRTIEYWMIRLCGWINARIGFAYVALSPYLATLIRQQGTVRPVDIIPIYGIDRQIFQPSNEPKAMLRERLGLPTDLPIVFFSSRIAPEKDADTLLRAVGLLSERGNPVWLLHLSGSSGALIERAASFGVGDRVIARDAVAPFAELADYYRASDLCVQASHAEGLGFSPLEALACGVPVVATDVGGLRDTIREGQTGWRVPPRDPAALADAIVSVLKDPVEASRRTSLGAQEIDRLYERRFVFDKFIARLGSGTPLSLTQ